MALSLYNTLTRQKEPFEPITPGKVTMYVCGVTVYDYCHLGHARALITFDVIARTLRFLGYDVIFVRNFTDIDDKIINRAGERKQDWRDLTREFIAAFHADTQALGLAKPQIEPLATEHIPEMIAVIQKLLDTGIAYQAGGDVFFAVRKFPGYGRLSGKDIDELNAGARVDVMEAKADPLDFALWKGAKPGEPSWPSPWGHGRPGWHIECSAMSMKYLSETFDIHGGGRDLIFPHHENEIAQSEGCTHKRFARYWLHNGFVNINREKMSKSLGNFLTIRDILKRYPGEVVRLFILSAHYRSPLDYTDGNIQSAFTGLKRYYQMRKRLEDTLAGITDGVEEESELLTRLDGMRQDFVSSLEDDFNTARIVGGVFDWVRRWNKILDEKQFVSAAGIKKFLTLMNEIHTVIGIFGSPAEAILAEMNAKGIGDSGINADEIAALVNERIQAKKMRDFKRADAIRDTLQKKGIQLKDNPDGTTSWETN
jgi:cysteinyl-tRNA synthetase